MEQQLKGFGGTLDGDGPSIGVERSLWIRERPTQEKKDRSLKYSLIFLHQGTTYLIRDGFDGRSSRETINEIARSIRWIPGEKQEASFKFIDKAATVMGGQIKISYPRAMRVVADKPDQFTAALPAATAGDPALALDVSLLTVKKGLSLGDFTTVLGDGLRGSSRCRLLHNGTRALGRPSDC